MDYEAIARKSTLRAEIRDLQFWKEYFHWSWKFMGFVAFLVVASSYNARKGLLESIAHITPATWAFTLGVAFFLGPAVFYLFATAFFKAWEWIDRMRSKKRGP